MEKNDHILGYISLGWYRTGGGRSLLQSEKKYGLGQVESTFGSISLVPISSMNSEIDEGYFVV